MAQSHNPYPVQFSVDSPEERRERRDRLSVLLRFILVIPIVIFSQQPPASRRVYVPSVEQPAGP